MDPQGGRASLAPHHGSANDKYCPLIFEREMNLVKINPRLRLIFLFYFFCITPDSLIILLIAELDISFVKEYFSAYLGFELCPVVVVYSLI